MRAGIVVIAFAFATAFAPVAEAAMVKAAYVTGGRGVRSWFNAYPGERNQVKLQMSGTTDTYMDLGTVIVSPFHEAELNPEYILDGSATPEPTLEECTYLGVSASCERSPTWGPIVWLDDGDDSIDIDADEGQPMAFVEGGDGADAVRSSGRVSFIAGSGADTLEAAPESAFRYDFDERPAVDLQIDLDGVADDGAPGEGDNVLPGMILEALLAGNHTITGHDGADTVRSSAGNQTMAGLAGADTLSGGVDDDVIDGGPGEDLLIGSGGNDTIRAQDGEVDRVSCGFDTDVAYVDAIDVLLSQDFDTGRCETVITG
ncbi:MAG: calcium-binding protein [Thermoleophilaceae bacterium]